jgi:O-antigen ligase
VFFYYWLIAVMPLDQHWLWGHTIAGDFTVIKALGLTAFGVAVLRLASRPAPARFLDTPQARWFLGLVLFQCLSSLVHLGGLVSPFGAYSHVFSIVTLFLTTLVMVDSSSRLVWSLLVAIGAVGFVSLYAIRTAQVYGATTRPGGMFGDSNEYALVVGMWMPLAFLWVLSQRPKWERIFCFACFSSALLGTTFGASRGGFLGLVASFLFLIWHSAHRARNLLLVVALVVPPVLLAPYSPLRRFEKPSYGDRQAEDARLITWKAGLRMVRAHPLAGVGLENFKSVVNEYEDPNEQVISLCHNTYIEIAAELGPLALVPFVGILVAAFLTVGNVRQRAMRERLVHEAAICLGMQAGIVSFTVSAFFVSAWWEKLVWLFIFLTMCVARLSRRGSFAGRRNRGGRVEPRGFDGGSESPEVAGVLGAR